MVLASLLISSLLFFRFKQAAAAQSTFFRILPAIWSESTPPSQANPDLLASLAASGADADAAVGTAAIDAAAAEMLLVASVVRRSMGHEALTSWPSAFSVSAGSFRKYLDQWDKREG